MKHPDVSVVIPVYNEEESIHELIFQINAVFHTYKTWEYVFIDDGSTDGSLSVLTKEKEKSKVPFTIVSFRKNRGKSQALHEGFLRASGDVVVTLDADLQDVPSEIPKLLAAIDQGADMVVGWRKLRKDSFSKKIQSFFFNSIVSRLHGVTLHDMNTGLKAMRREVATEIDVYGELHRFIPVLAAQKGFVVSEMPVIHNHRKYGVSKFNSKRIIYAMFDLISTLFLSAFSTRPLQVFGSVGLFFGGLGSVILLYLTIIWFMGESIGRRPLLLLGVLLVVSGVQLVSTGLLGELLIHETRRNLRSKEKTV